MVKQMDKVPDILRELRLLLDQIPEGEVTTPKELAEALGDPISYRTVKKLLLNIEGYETKVSEGIGVEPVFRGFESSRPLERIAEYQRRMAGKVKEEDYFNTVELVAGVDASYKGRWGYGACVVTTRDQNIVESSSVRIAVEFPYIPGYLAFREAAVVQAGIKDKCAFDVLMVNGHGVAHPRGFGLASHIGVELDVPTIGVAKRILFGRLGEVQESYQPVIHGGRIVGARIKGGDGAQLFVSVGNRVTLATSIKMVRSMIRDGRFPEPLRRAHELSRKARDK